MYEEKSSIQKRRLKNIVYIYKRAKVYQIKYVKRIAFC